MLEAKVEEISIAAKFILGLWSEQKKAFMKKILKFCNKTWQNAILTNAFLPTGMIPYNVNKVD